MRGIGAIETQYGGYRFRSRLEARWAVFLEALGEEYEYEKQGYSLPSGNYLPDFWLPRLSCWLEIKGTAPSEQEVKFCEELGEETNAPAAIAWGLPVPPEKKMVYSVYSKSWNEVWDTWGLMVYCCDCTESSGGCGMWGGCFWALDLSGRLCICSNNNRSDRSFMTPNFQETWPGMKLLSEIHAPISEHHVSRAKSARFEFQR